MSDPALGQPEIHANWSASIGLDGMRATASSADPSGLPLVLEYDRSGNGRIRRFKVTVEGGGSPSGNGSSITLTARIEGEVFDTNARPKIDITLKGESASSSSDYRGSVAGSVSVSGFVPADDDANHPDGDYFDIGTLAELGNGDDLYQYSECPQIGDIPCIGPSTGVAASDARAVDS
ncbi:MAG: hypothetical protein AAF170_19275, partial [Bacteroidota bacterium]